MIRVFPKRIDGWTPTDDLCRFGPPDMFDLGLERSTPVRVSVAFTWDIEKGLSLEKAWSSYFSDVQIGGPAFGDNGCEFVSGRFLGEGITITSRGCPRRCPWCYVWRREGNKVREYPIQPGWVVQDNNLLACSDEHLKAVFAMLSTQRKGAYFKGGLDARLFTPEHAAMISDMRLNEAWFACDTPAGMRHIEKVAELTTDISQNKKRCFVLLGYDKKETLEQAEQRLKRVLNLGFLPFSQLYQSDEKKKYPADWHDLNAIWSQPRYYRKYMGAA